MAFKMDMSKFKLTSSDKKSATLKHDDGHEIKVAINALSPQMRKELQKLPKVKEDPEMLADGGSVGEPNKKAAAEVSKGASASGWQPDVWKANAKSALGLAKGGYVELNKHALDAKHAKDKTNPKMTSVNSSTPAMAHGGEVGGDTPAAQEIQRRMDKRDADEEAQRQKNRPKPRMPESQSQAQPKKASMFDKPEGDLSRGLFGLAEGGVVGAANSQNQQGNLKEGKAEKPNVSEEHKSYGDLDQVIGHMKRIGQMLLHGPAAGGAYADGGEVSGPIQSEMPKDDLMADLDQVASQQQSALQAADLVSYESPSQAKGIGTDPLTGDQMASPQADALPGAPGASPSPDQGAISLQMPPVDNNAVQQAVGAQAPVDKSGIPSLEQNATNMMSGIRQEAKGQMSINHANQKALDDQVTKQASIDQTFQEKEKTLNDSIDHLSKEVSDGKINPNRIYENMSTGGHIATAIGLILGGIGAGLSRGENQGMKTLDNIISRDIDAQKANLNNKHSLLSESVRMMGNLRDGQKFASVQLADITAKQMLAKANSMSDPVLKGQMMQKVAQFAAPYAAEKQKLAAQAAVNTLENQAQRDPSKMGTYLEALKRVDPKQYEHMLGRAVPGLGFANTDKDASMMKELDSSVQGAKSSIKELTQLIDKGGKSLSPADHAKAGTLQQTLIGQLRTAILGPGTINEGERAMMEKIIANPTKFLTLDGSNKVRLQTLMHTLDTKTKAAAESVGLKVRPNAAEARKIQIAQSNPDNPKAQQFLKLMQDKYGR